MVHWLPVPDGVYPVFLRYVSDDAVKALTVSQVELHKLRLQHARLLAEAKQNELEWAAIKGSMEDEMRSMQVRTIEAERLFNEKAEDLKRQLEDKQDRLLQLQQQHSRLKNASTETIQQLQQTLQELERSCADLQAKNEDLQEQLRGARVTEELRKRAEQRASELDNAIVATRERAKEAIVTLDRQRQEAEAQKAQLERQLGAQQQELQRQVELRQLRELDALRLAVERQRLWSALEVERLINAPLRNTTYEATTLAHVMRSAAADMVAAHSTASPGQRGSGPVVSSVSLPGSPSDDTGVIISDSGAPGGARGLDGGRRSVGRLSAADTFADRDLTVLGRSWATTTPTAGSPHPAFLDNIQRYKQRYEQAARAAAASPLPAHSALGRTRPASALPARRRLPRLHGEGGDPFLTPQKLQAAQDAAAPGSGSSVRTVPYIAELKY